MHLTQWKKNYNAMAIRIKRLVNEWGLDAEKIILEKAGVSNKNQKCRINIGSVGSGFYLDNVIESQKKEEFLIYTLDDYFDDKEITFIKADIEGSEMAMLLGAENIIRKRKPKMALSVYHKMTDMFDFIDYLQKIAPEYKFRLRHHSYNSDDTVLYCNI
jgi:FkbM family methyltransferase